MDNITALYAAQVARPLVLHRSARVLYGTEEFFVIDGSSTVLRWEGVSFNPKGKVDFVDREPVVGADGATWEAWGEGLHLYARRPRTPQERQEYRDYLSNMMLNRVRH